MGDGRHRYNPRDSFKIVSLRAWEGAMDWSPRLKTSFSDEELIEQLAATEARPERRVGNWWTFFSNLPRPEQDRLQQEAQSRRGSTPANDA